MFQKKLKIALFSNTFGLRDAMGRHVHLIKKVFPEAEIFLERESGDPRIPTRNYYFVKRYPYMSLYMLEWKLGVELRLLEYLFLPWEKLAFKHEAKKFAQFDVVWLEWGLYHQAIHLFPILASFSKRPKLIFDYHGITPPKYILSRGKKLIAEKTIAVTREGAENADVCLVRSHFMEKELKTYSYPQKIVLNPLPLIPLSLPANYRLGLRKKYQLENKKIILYVGRISSHKNLEIVIQALKLLTRQDVIFVVVGNYRHRSLAQEKERLVRLVRDLRLPHRVIFTGELPDEELFSWYKTCDLFIIPSFHEGFCWPLLDAMASDVPILASRFGAIPETVGEAALFFDAQNPEDLKEKINQLLEDEGLRSNLIQAGLDKAKEYSFERYRRELQQVIDF